MLEMFFRDMQLYLNNNIITFSFTLFLNVHRNLNMLEIAPFEKRWDMGQTF